VEKLRLKWLGDAENAFRELRVKRWRRKASNREEWTSVVKDDVHRGPSQKEPGGRTDTILASIL
jgi:hypothetical protein